MPFKSFEKSLTQLQRIGQGIPRVCRSGRQYEVDIELMLEQAGIEIDAVPLADKGIVAWISLSGRKLYVDIGLADKDWLEKRYRFTLAEEYSHTILHKDLFVGIATPEQWVKKWQGLPEEIYRRLDQQAKELAGILLMPEDTFRPRMIALRDDFANIEGASGNMSLEQKARIAINVRKTLIDDYNVSEHACSIRIQRLAYPKDLFSV
ncbi:MAG: ImmA/IrrE family metallo-endopeptidase [Elusimicrobia bacterium]|nr:ImmA/IrrE family metallo-endopeptidase [Elusimicrobiota bacterium]